MNTFDPGGSTDADRLQRLQALDELLPALADVLDIREVFERLAAIAPRVIEHDVIALPLLAEGNTTVTVHAAYAAEHRIPRDPQPIPLTEAHEQALRSGVDQRIFDEGTLENAALVAPPAQHGIKSLLRVVVRLRNDIAGVLDFGSLTPHAYTAADLMIARRIADHVALALSHQRLAEKSRRATALQERTATFELLDGLLSAVTDVLDIREIFDRVSEVAGKVLMHDAIGIPVVTDDREHMIVHASKGLEVSDLGIIPIHESMRPLIDGDWEYDIVDDLRIEPRGLGPQRLALLGFRSVLRAPVRISGQVAALLSFFSRQERFYTPPDTVIARRIANHVAMLMSHQRLAEQAQRAAEARERAALLERRVDALTAEVQALGGHRRVVGESKAWKDVLKQATQVAPTEATVLLLGDSGTGKEVVARFIHRASSRGGPFVALNCAALPEQLLESELFGYERGAFTGALHAKPGQIEQAAGGVLFLDEVSEMSLSAQAKFLRVLQEREFQRLGGTRVLKANVRVIAATNRDLATAIERGTFREDFYYRLHVFEIALPRLRDRPDDILPLSEAFLEDIAKGFGRPPAGISRDARRLLVDYHWPGNVRQLRNTLERAAILCEGGLITGDHLSLPGERPLPAQPAAAAPAVAVAARADLKSMERAAIEQALATAKHNKSKAARLLGLTRTQLYVRLRKYGLES